MIRTFRNKGLKAIAERGDVSKLSVQNPERIRRVLLVLDAATAPEHVNLPGYRFQRLRGRDKGRYSVWVSGNYRITFGWAGEDATDVDLEDYH